MRTTNGSILMISMAPTAVGHVYRVLNHAECFEQLGFVVHVVAAAGAAAAVEALPDLQCVLVFRPCLDSHFLQWRSITSARNIPLLADLDDLTFDVSLLDSGEWHYWQGLEAKAKLSWRDRFERQCQALKQVDGVVVSTAPLAEAVERLGRPSWVWRNGFGQLSWAIAARQRRLDAPPSALGEVVIGYASGTPTHAADFAVVAPALAKLCADFPQVRLEVLGALALDEHTVLTPYKAQIYTRPAVPYPELPAALARFDVNVAPLDLTSRFCAAKSELKFFEAAVVGVPTVASPTPPFDDLIDHRQNGCLATSEQDWFQALSWLVLNPAQRHRMARCALRTTRRRFSPVAQVRDLKQLLKAGMLTR